MCGIAGLFALRNGTPGPDALAAQVGRMNDALAHRGPDGDGVWADPAGRVALGHRRLSIIDLAGSPQPMASADDRFLIVFNGEIYNFRALRTELAALGHRFITDGDTEAILAAWAEWGPAALDRLDGMFAFALFDRQDGSLVLARDRLGVKPLFYAELPDGCLAFGSELKALLALPELPRAPDVRALDAYLAWGYVPDHHALVAGTAKLPAAHWLRLAADRPVPAPVRWWDVDFSGRAKGDATELGEELHRLLGEAVRSRMVADVPLGAFLSGGVDSSTVVALMAAASAAPVQTCSIGFDVGALDETRHARIVAERFATDHSERIVAADDFGLIDRLAEMFDEPFADASALPTYRVCELARERVTVALSGDGADEALAGYRRQVFHANEERARGMLPAAIRRPLFGALGSLYPKADWAPRHLRAKATLLALAADGDAAYAAAVGVTGRDERAALYTPDMVGSLGGFDAEGEWIGRMRAAPARSGLDRAQYADLTFWLPGDILTKVDRTSMAVGLEAREPLLDHRLVQFAASLPDAMRVRGREGKWLMKQAMERHLPHDILYRPKMGFVTPIAQWLRGPLAGEARAIAGLARTGWFDAAALAQVAEAHIAGRRDSSRLIWQLIMLDKALVRLFGM